MEHGQSIARRLGLAVAAETFNPVIVDFYEQVGYLPDAILNYLLLLGWSLDDKTEEFTREEMLRHFSLERVNKAPASFDPEKLVAFEARAMQQLPIKQRWPRSCRSCSGRSWSPIRRRATRRRMSRSILEAAGDRVKVAGDILDYDEFFVADDAVAVRRGGVRQAAAKTGRRASSCLAKFRERTCQRRAVHGRAARKDDARIRRRARHQDRRHRARRPRRRDGQGGRLRAVRHAGHSRPRAVPGRIDRALEMAAAKSVN